MSRLTWALCAVTIILVVLSIVRAARGQPWPRPARIVAVVAVILAIADVAVNEVQFLLVPVYLAVALLAVRLWVWGRGHGLWRYRWLGVASGLVFLLLVLADTALVRMMASLGDANELFVTRRESPDLRGKGWEAGFREANAFLAEDYAFGKWRRVNFDSLVNVYAPRVAAAEQRKDWRAYYQAVREYLWSIPDSHVEIGSDSTDVRQQHIEGGYGFALARLDDGRVVASVLLDASPAALAGMGWGAEIVRWNGAPVDSAVDRASVLWNGSPPSTREGLALARLRWMARDTIGARLTLSFRNQGDTTVHMKQLVAVRDSMRAILRSEGMPVRFLTDAPVDWKVLPSGTGYLRIRYEFVSLKVPFPELVVRSAVMEFNKRGVPGVIVDVRGNPGGADRLVALLMGYFYDRPHFYESATYFNPATRRFEVDPRSRLTITPRSVTFLGPVVALVDDRCGSSCEGIAMAIRQRPRSAVVGFAATEGAFGMSGASIALPGGVSIEYPNGQSVDSAGVVQIDSDWRMMGGVAPTVRLAVTLERLHQRYVDGRDVVLEEGERALRRIH